jgi:hypothetical protein
VKKLQRTAGFQTVRGGDLVFFQNPFVNHRDINLDTHRHRQTDRSQTDWPASVGRNYTEAVCPGRFSHTKSVCPSVRPTVRAESRFPNPTVRAGSAGGLKRGTVVSRTDGQPTWIYIEDLLICYFSCCNLNSLVTKQNKECVTLGLGHLHLKSILRKKKKKRRKFKYFTMQKYNLQKIPLQQTKILQYIITKEVFFQGEGVELV